MSELPAKKRTVSGSQVDCGGSRKRNKDQLVAEYAAVNKLGHLEPTKENVDAAIRFMLKIVLRDLSPPWAMYIIPQALPENGVLARYTRPSFLQWDKATGRKVFGDAVADAFLCVHCPSIAGYLARPLYVCTSTSERGGVMCMSVASMSEWITHVSVGNYRCGNCVRKGAGELASGSSPLRLLHLYALVDNGGGVLMPVHSQPARLVVCAPPAKWDWCRELRHDERPQLDEHVAMPEQARDSRGEHWRFDPEESAAIWCHAGLYRDVGSSGFHPAGL